MSDTASDRDKAHDMRVNGLNLATSCSTNRHGHFPMFLVVAAFTYNHRILNISLLADTITSIKIRCL